MATPCAATTTNSHPFSFSNHPHSECAHRCQSVRVCARLCPLVRISTPSLTPLTHQHILHILAQFAQRTRRTASLIPLSAPPIFGILVR